MSNHYTKSKILSNSEFYYKDKQNDLPKDHIIQLNHEFEKKLEIPHQIPLGKLKGYCHTYNLTLRTTLSYL